MTDTVNASLGFVCWNYCRGFKCDAPLSVAFLLKRGRVCQHRNPLQQLCFKVCEPSWTPLPLNIYQIVRPLSADAAAPPTRAVIYDTLSKGPTHGCSCRCNYLARSRLCSWKLHLEASSSSRLSEPAFTAKYRHGNTGSQHIARGLSVNHSFAQNRVSPPQSYFSVFCAILRSVSAAKNVSLAHFQIILSYEPFCFVRFSSGAMVSLGGVGWSVIAE